MGRWVVPGSNPGCVLVMGVLLASCGKPVVANKEPPVGPPQIRIAQVGADNATSEVSGVGTVAVQREASLGFTSAGRILRLSVNEGDRVRRGQVLAALDTTTVAAELARAQAERTRAAAEYARSATLISQGWITKPRLDNARAALDAAEAQVRAAGFQAANATIVAPGSGTVLARLAEPGQVVAAGTPVLTLGEEASGYVLRVPLSDRDAARLTAGAPATVTLAALGDEAITGRIVEIGGRADRATGTFAVEIALPGDPRLRSGQIGTARIVAGGAREAVLRVPATAIFAARAGDGFVYVVDRARRRVALRQVSIAEADDGGIRVTGGLRPGEFVATSRVDRLKDGMAIAPIGITAGSVR
jgi:RND family efflux transporter MFP subunit